LSAYSDAMSQTAIQRQPDYLGLVAAGYVMAFVLPVGGFVIGCLLCEKRTGHAIVMLMLSVWSAMFWTFQLLG